MNTIVVKVSDFTTLPGARHREDGDGSADQFFEERVLPILRKILENKESKIIIDLDGTLGYASSFISQLAVRIKGEVHNKRTIKKRLIIKSDDDENQKERFWDEIKQK